jgi:hypothetical protein
VYSQKLASVNIKGVEKMTRLIPRVMLIMMVVSLLFIGTAAANALVEMHYEGAIPREPSEEPSENAPAMSPPGFSPYFRDDYRAFNNIIERIQSYSHGRIRIIPYDTYASRVAQFYSGNFPGLADGYNSDRQDLFNDFRTRV